MARTRGARVGSIKWPLGVVVLSECDGSPLLTNEFEGQSGKRIGEYNIVRLSDICGRA